MRLGGGSGILNALSSFVGVGWPLLSLLIVPVGAWAVFMLEYGLNLFFFSLSGVPSLSFTLSKLDRLLSSYAWKGFRNIAFLTGLLRCFWDCVRGEAFRLLGVGWNDSSKTLTKLLGNSPTALGSRRSLPIHQRPSPAFNASIRSPSMNPKSFFDSPPQEYVA